MREIACLSFTPPAPLVAELVSAPPSDAASISTQVGHRHVFFTDVLLDTGAQLSCIKASLLPRLGLALTPPVGIRELSGFAKGTKTPRIGTVSTTVTLHLPLSTPGTVTFTKTFEVVDINHDFIVGIDILKTIFPNDQTYNYTAAPSTITDAPSDVSWGTVNEISDDSATTDAARSSEGIRAGPGGAPRDCCGQEGPVVCCDLGGDQQGRGPQQSHPSASSVAIIHLPTDEESSALNPSA